MINNKIKKRQVKIVTFENFLKMRWVQKKSSFRELSVLS